jgi:pyridoxine kinase
VPAKFILSISSHVAYGHVGNAAAVFPLQRLGFEVWPVMTVQLSNHPGYGDAGGGPLPEAALRDTLAGLERRGVISSCHGLLTGYLGGAGSGAAVLDAAAALKAANPRALYLCDPVMGDDAGGLYVDAAIPALFRERALPLAEVVTPNRFELASLAETEVGGLADAVAAARGLIARGPRLVLVTSLPAEDGGIAMALVAAEDAWSVSAPRIAFEQEPHGAGDLAAALLLGQLLKGRGPEEALARMAAAVDATLRHSFDAGGELALVAAQEVFDGAEGRPEVRRLD